jgi:predicted TIM-barrel fold metal-dependent hydrolase
MKHNSVPVGGRSRHEPGDVPTASLDPFPSPGCHEGAPGWTRREFLAATVGVALAGVVEAEGAEVAAGEAIIDIHQHTNYAGRTDDQLVAHQRAMGITKTVLLPAGRLYGLDAQCGGNETVRLLGGRYPKEFVFFANEVAGLPEAVSEITSFLKKGAIGIGEQKFKVECDSRAIEALAELAQTFRVPVLLHFQHGAYNVGLERFHRILAKFPKVAFIGHAQTWWGNIDRNHDQAVLYPKGKVTPGGITDRLLSEYPNMYGDLSAGSGLNALQRDEDHARAFLLRHQDKLLFGSDCDDIVGSGPKCQGSQTIATVRRLVPEKRVRRKLFYANAKRLLKL